MAILLALCSSIFYGSGDFFGGLSARRLPPLVIGMVTHGMVVIPMAILALLVGADKVGPADLAWGAAGAVAGGLGVVMLYKGLAVGPMSVVSPITAVVSVVVPIVVGLAGGERPSVLQWLGIACALVAIFFMTRTSEVSDTKLAGSTMLVAVAAGLGFGFFFVALERTSSASGLWPITAGRLTSATMFTLLVRSAPSARGHLRAIRGRLLGWTSAAAFGDVAANVLYLLAVRRGSLSIVAVLSSLYPGATVVLANRVLHERLAAAQRFGLVAAFAAILLVVAG